MEEVMSLQVLAGGNGFFKQWEPVLLQIVPLIDSGLSMKEALLRYKYPGSLPNLTKDISKKISSVDFDEGVIHFKEDNDLQLYWCVYNEREQCSYWFDVRFAACPDGTVLMFD
jgi:hypothetical protein